MAKLGATKSDVDMTAVLGAMNVRAGHVAITSLLTSIDVTFTTALPDNTYELLLFMSGVAVAFTVSAKLTTGFTVGFTVGLTGTLSYIAIAGV